MHDYIVAIFWLGGGFVLLAAFVIAPMVVIDRYLKNVYGVRREPDKHRGFEVKIKSELSDHRQD